LAVQVAGEKGDDGPGDEGPALGERLASLEDARRALKDGAPRLVVADNPEDEALLVAGRVAAWLEDHGTPDRGITVATADPRLASRVTARLRDAGLDADNTVGEPLSALPAGLLIRFILRAALTDLRADPLLEILGHPYTELGDAEAATGTWALRLERMFRRESGPQSGLAGLHRRALDRDEAALRIFQRQTAGMQDFVGRLAGAFDPLLTLVGERQRPWSDYLEALTATWEALAPERVLNGGGEPDLQAAAELLGELATESPRLPEVTLSGFAADLGRLLSSATVTPHRPQGIPIQVTGLVEARLARSDFLILAGLNEGVFPSPTRNPVVLPGRVRKLLGLPTWREARAADAELFLRLLYGAPDVVLSWSRHRDGAPCLASPLVDRLQLGLGSPEIAEPERLVWRREQPRLDEVAAAQTAFRAEPEDVPRHVKTRPLTDLSWSTLRLWRDCPYRTLLERGLALRAEEEVRDEFGKKEYGSIVHAVLAEVLAEGHACRDALVDGDATAAAGILTDAAREAFLPGAAELPVRRLWLESFLRIVPLLAAVESKRMAAWRPAALEVGFELPLVRLVDWARDHASVHAIEPAAALPAQLPAYAETVVLKGVVDRIDRAVAGDSSAVIDYKTGNVPANKRVLEFEDLQLPMYALAVETGAVPGAAGPVGEGFFYNLDEKKFGPSLNRGNAPLDGDDELLVHAAFELARLALGAADPDAVHPLLPRAAAEEVTGALPCKWCDLRGACRIEERCPTPAVAVQLDKIVNAREVTG
jgi:ATP-dependent helicase/nuclease subunit B